MIEFNIPQMSCGHCVKAVTQAVKEVDAQAQVNVDLSTKKVSVQSDAPRDKLVGALAEAGYAPVAA